MVGQMTESKRRRVISVPDELSFNLPIYFSIYFDNQSASNVTVAEYRSQIWQLLTHYKN